MMRIEKKLRKKHLLIFMLFLFTSLIISLVCMFLSNPPVHETFMVASSEKATRNLKLKGGDHVSIWLSTLPPGMSGRSAQGYVINFYVTDPNNYTVLDTHGIVGTGELNPETFVAQQEGVYTMHFINNLGGSFDKTVRLHYRTTKSILGVPFEYILVSITIITLLFIVTSAVLTEKGESTSTSMQTEDSSFLKGSLEASQSRKVPEDLRTGFKFSLISVAASLLWFSGWGLFLVIPIYIYGIIKRSRGWRSLGFERTCLIIRLGATLTVLCPLVTLAAFLVPSIPFIYLSFFFYLVPSLMVVTWSVYTCCENRALKKLGEELGIDLKKTRFFALSGVIIVLAVMVISLFSVIVGFTHFLPPISAAYTIPLMFLAIPFPIASCYLFLKKTK